MGEGKKGERDREGEEQRKKEKRKKKGRERERERERERKLLLVVTFYWMIQNEDICIYGVSMIKFLYLEEGIMNAL